MSDDEELNIRFDITRGFDIPQFRLILKHKRTNVESSFVYLAWLKTGISNLREVTEYSADPSSELRTFSSSLREVIFQRVVEYDPQIEATRVWRMTFGNYSLIVSWLCDDVPIEMNLQTFTQA